MKLNNIIIGSTVLILLGCLINFSTQNASADQTYNYTQAFDDIQNLNIMSFTLNDEL